MTDLRVVCVYATAATMRGRRRRTSAAIRIKSPGDRSGAKRPACATTKTPFRLKARGKGVPMDAG